MRLAAIIASVAMLAGCQMAPPVAHTQAGGALRVSGDPGGDIDERLAHIRDLRASDTHVIIDGPCWSACTLYLALQDACVTPMAYMRFHGPVHQFSGLAAGPQRGASARAVMMASYAHYPDLQAWIARNDVLQGSDWHDLDYEQLVAMGVPTCRH